jgi:hypothetical protein
MEREDQSIKEALERIERSLAWVMNAEVKLLRLFAAQWVLTLNLLHHVPTSTALKHLSDLIGLHEETVMEVVQELQRLLEASSAPPEPGDKQAN